MKRLTVKNEKKYDICFSESFSGLSDEIKNICSPKKKAFIISDSNVAPIYLSQIRNISSECFSGTCEYIIPAGEQSKTLERAKDIILVMIGAGFTRDDVIIALGGGVTGDLAGFCAAIYMRGIDFIQIPTSLLAQIDSSIGGKVAIDMDSYKNMAGAFHNPILVYENSSCLKTLPEGQLVSGMGEAVKSALLGDASLWNFMLEKIKGRSLSEIDDEILTHILYSVCLVKKKVVEEDPYDKGQRAVLNLGHTVGHAIEKCSDFSLSHGQCVCLGCVCAAYISMKREYISIQDYNLIIEFMDNTGLPVHIPEGIRLERCDIMSAILKDKKNGADGLKFILLEEIGKAVIKSDVSDIEIAEGLKIIGI